MNENHAKGSKCSLRNDQQFKRQPGHRCAKNRVARLMRILAGLDTSLTRR